MKFTRHCDYCEKDGRSVMKASSRKFICGRCFFERKGKLMERMKPIKFILEYSKGLSLVAIETFRKKKRNCNQKSAYMKDCRKRFTAPEGQGKDFNEFLKSLKHGDRIEISRVVE